jgi:AraC family transcriptional regulator
MARGSSTTGYDDSGSKNLKDRSAAAGYPEVDRPEQAVMVSMESSLSPHGSARDLWLDVLNRNGIAAPESLRVMVVPGGLVHATSGEPPGRLSLDGVPANLLMFNVSPVQGLKQKRNGRAFVSDMLSGDMTLLPRGVPSQWEWNSTCDRFDVMVPSDVFGDGCSLDVVDRFLFRDSEVETICRKLHREVNLAGGSDRLYIESLVTQVAEALLRRHSTGSEPIEREPRGGITRPQAKRVLEYVESNLSHEVTLRELAATAGLSPHHFARMFKQTIGVPPHRYVMQRRVERAKAMLRSTGASLVDVGLFIGFCGQSHFTTTFHRLVGVTPAEFRRFSQATR